MDRYWRCLLRKCTRNILRPEDRDADVPKFSHPSFLFFFTSLLTTVLLFPVLLLVLISPSLKTAHAPLILIPLLTTMATLLFTILSNYLVRRAHTKESQRVVRMLTDAAGSARREGDEAVARALVGLEAPGVWNKIVGFFSGIIGLIAGLASLIIVTVSLQAYKRHSSCADAPSYSSSTYPLPLMTAQRHSHPHHPSSSMSSLREHPGLHKFISPVSSLNRLLPSAEPSLPSCTSHLRAFLAHWRSLLILSSLRRRMPSTLEDGFWIFSKRGISEKCASGIDRGTDSHRC
jgi:hypothetical protein